MLDLTKARSSWAAPLRACPLTTQLGRKPGISLSNAWRSARRSTAESTPPTSNREVLQRLDCCRTNGGPLSSPRSAPNPDRATSPLALPPALCCNSGVLQPQPRESREPVRLWWRAGPLWQGVMGGVPPYLSYFPGRVGGQDDADACAERKKPPLDGQSTGNALHRFGEKNFSPINQTIKCPAGQSPRLHPSRRRHSI